MYQEHFSVLIITPFLQQIKSVRVLKDQACDVTVTFTFRCSNELELITCQPCITGACVAQSVCICCGQDNRVIGVRFPASAETFPHNLRTDAVAHSAHYPVCRHTKSFSEGLIRTWREADISPPSVFQIKNVWYYIFAPLYI